MKGKKFISIWMISVIVILGISILINVIIDPYGILKDDFSNQKVGLNLNYIKVKHILNNKKRYDSFIFGSSRVDRLNPKFIKNANYYNMTISQGLPKEYFEIIELFKKENINIKNIIIGIDDFDFSLRSDSHNGTLSNSSYLYIKKNKLKMLSKYFIRNPFNEANRKQLKGKKKLEFNIYNYGNVEEIEKDIWIKENIENHLKDSKFLKPTVFGDYDNIAYGVKYYKKIAELCKLNNINLILFFQPHNKISAMNLTETQKKEIKRKLSEFAYVYDFYYPNSITNNNYYWYETSHYRPMVADMILKYIFKDDYSKEIKVPADFGRLIKKKMD